MTIYEYGIENEKLILLIHPSMVMWDYFEYVIPLLESDYHLIIPALPGYDEKNPDENFTSVEQIADELVAFFIAQNIESIDLLYGCSMGGSIVLRLLATQKLTVKHAICDGAITPYQLPWIVTRLIAVKDFLMVSIGKHGGLRLLERAFSADEYGEADVQYLHKVLHFMSYKTIWRTFESCNNYSLTKNIPQFKGWLEYWYGEKEAKARGRDIQYMKKSFPNTKFIEFKDRGHASMATLYPQTMAECMRALLENDG